ncbi:transposase [Porphyromonas gingivicanis]|uniref:Transposase n=1 Tax=Porphyromonas gingivicanis TaxID=266762 RepID=A0A0A2G7G1_9PORP|nr:transposase [Porphyromonas gingivicanis]
MKSDYRLGRNFYKGLIGDAINILLVAVAYNFKRAMKALSHLLKIIIEKPWMDDFPLINAF